MVDDASPTAARVAVVGAGWAGCAAAVTLAQARIPVVLFEQAKTLGGRARRVTLEGHSLDNGQHLFIGAYRKTLELLALVHRPDALRTLFRRLPMSILPFGQQPHAVRFSAWPAPAPFHLLGGIACARGLDRHERKALVASFLRLARSGFRCAPEASVAQYFAAMPARAFAAVWAPLCLAALNTPPERASAQVFAAVLRAALTGTAANSEFMVPLVDLSACFPDAAARFVVERGGIVRAGVGIRAIAHQGGQVALHAANGSEHFGAVVVAVGPHQLAALVGHESRSSDAWRAPLAQVGAFQYESITTIYLGFAGTVAFAAPLLRLDDTPGQWVFDRSAAILSASPASAETGRVASLVAVVISAGGAHDDVDHPTLATAVEAQLRRLAPDLPRVVWSRVIAEQRATYACTPALGRPRHGRIAPRLFLAGDYTDPEFPPTLEAATRSGVAAARALIDERATRA